jgi:GT2 family glycosyltransferase
MAATVRVSVVIPCRNEAKHIIACLRSVLAQEPPDGGFEVVVADGMSTDGTRELVRESFRSNPRLRLIDNPAQTTPAGLNRAIAAAEGQIIVRMDAHSEYPATYIRACVSVLETTGAQNVGGVWEVVPSSHTTTARAIGLIQGHWFGVGNARFRTKNGGAGPADTVPFGCFRREVFDRIGLFDERLIRGQDLEFNARIRRHGGTVYLASAIHCFYHPPATWADFGKKQFRNGLWVIYQAAFTSLRTIRIRHLVPLAFVVAIVATVGLWFVTGLGSASILLASILIPYFTMAVVIGVQLERRSRSSSIAENVPWYVFPPLLFYNHASYGLGSLWGMVTVWKLRGCRRNISFSKGESLSTPY